MTSLPPKTFPDAETKGWPTQEVSTGSVPPATSSTFTDSWLKSGGDHTLARIGERMGVMALNRRLRKQVAVAAEIMNARFPALSRDEMYGLHTVLVSLLKFTGLYNYAQRQTSLHEVTQRDVVIESLPELFDGFRLLHLSDLHFEHGAPFVEAIMNKVSSLSGSYDLCVITGDFRMALWGPYDSAVELTGELIRRLSTPAFGILGNHDAIEMVHPLEAQGLRLLLNESVPLRRGDEEIYLLGVDDPHSYRTHDLPRALQGVPAEATKILLSHSAENYDEAIQGQVQMFLCGHTHGGQICLPGGWPLWVNARTPRRFCAGAWEEEGVQGYTLRGTGCSGVSARLFCPPEIAIHTLRRAP